jgi:hypothetical protein
VSGNRQAGQRPTASRGSNPGRRTPKPRQSQAGRPPARRPLPPGQSLYTPTASPARQAVERRSAAPLVFLHQLPRWVPPAALAVLLVVGLAVHGVIGAIALIGVTLVLVWLALLSWPRLSRNGRAFRVVVIALVIAVVVLQILR